MLLVLAVVWIFSSVSSYKSKKNAYPSPLEAGTKEVTLDESVGKKCTTSKDCAACTQSCVSGACQDNGKIKCETGTPGEGNCVNDNIDCECNPACNGCTEVCAVESFGVYICKPKPGNYEECPNGECVSFPQTCNDCNPACNSCERCKVSSGGTPGCVKDDTKVSCPGTNYCVDKGFEDRCPQKGYPDCPSCIQECYDDPSDADGPYCRSRDYKICPQDGSCSPNNFDCSKLSSDK